MALYFKIEGDNIVFFGDTFNHRPAIKELGARFNGADKTWVVPDTKEMRDRASLIAKSKDLKTEPSPREPVDASLGVTVAQLMSLAEKSISQTFPTPIWVLGEIQGLTKRGGGTIYFDFAEAKAGAHETATVTIKCNIWQNTVAWLNKRHGAEKIESILADGNRLRALVHVKLYKDRGQITLTIEDVDPSFTQGALALARAELLKKLRKLGLDQKNKLIPIPSFPFRVALITAEGSRAQSDFEHQLTASRQFAGTIVFIPCAMQGDSVPRAVTASIAAAQGADADLIVICRGGGSAADLRWFDGEEIAMAIAHSKVPIIAAIGHHEDTCVAEEICHIREKTPTAAADRILEIFRDTRAAVNERAHFLAVNLDKEMTKFDRLQGNMRDRLSAATDHFFARQREGLVISALALQREFVDIVNQQEANFLSSAAELNHFANTSLNNLAELLFERHRLLTGADPSPWIEAGWTQINIAGKSIRSIDDVKIGSLVSTRLRDGVLRLKVETKELRTKGKRDEKGIKSQSI